MNPRVSIIIPTYNRANFIRHSIDSALGQTFNDCEVIVVDDGSTDNTKEVVESYGGKVQYVYQENMGPPGAMNTGVRRSKGEYYLILGDDDELESDIIERHVKILDEQSDVAFVCSGIHFVDMEGQIYKTSIDGRNREWTFKSLLFDNFVWHLTVLVRRSVSDEMGHLDETLLTTHDYDFWIRISLKYKFRYTDLPLAKFRRHPGNFSKTLGLHLKDHLTILNKPEVRKNLTLLEWLKFRAVNFYRFSMFYARTGEYLKASGCYWAAVLNHPLIGMYFWTHETKSMRFSLPYRILKPYLMPFYYLLKIPFVVCSNFLKGKYKKDFKEEFNVQKDNLV